MEVNFEQMIIPTSPTSYQQKGFTIVEMLVVIIIATILASFASIRWSTNTNLNAQAQQLAADIRYVQSLAMTHGERYRLTLTAPNTYSISTTAGSAVPNTVTHSNSTTFDTGIVFGTINGLTNNVIAFDGRGSPYTGTAGTTVLASTATINLSWGNDIRQILINPAGQVSVQ